MSFSRFISSGSVHTVRFTMFSHRFFRRCLRLLPFCFLILLLLHPKTAFRGAETGLLLWFNILLPTLFPFLVVTDFCMRSGLVESVFRRILPLFQKIPGFNPYLLYPFLLGILSGLPLGARLTGESVRHGFISVSCGQFMLTVCNNCSLVFLTGYLASQQLKEPSFAPALCLILYLSSFLSAFLCHLMLKSRKKNTPAVSSQITSEASTTQYGNAASRDPVLVLLNKATLESFLVLEKIGGFVILFSICSEYLFISKSFAALLISAALEVTGGIRALCAYDLPQNIKAALSIAFAAFTGLSGLAQTGCVINGTGLSMSRYVLSRIIACCIAFILSLLYFKYFL